VVCIDDAVWGSFAADRLSEAEAAEVREHLSTCEVCRHRRLSTIATLPGSKRRSERPHRKPLPLGMRLGRYHILEPIDSGGMGAVYAALDPELDRKVALKVLRAGLDAKDSQFRLRLLREAQAMARLSHPNVITVYDVGTPAEDAHVYIAMELVDGGTLRQWLRTAPRSSRDVLATFIQAGRGLAAAHKAGLIHRDFKPENVLIGKDGSVRVTDFGLVRSAHEVDTRPTGEGGAPTEGAADESEPDDEPTQERLAARVESGEHGVLATPLTRCGSVLGSPGYMAPEQYNGQPVDPRSDQFAFCVSLYEALYGERPFAGSTFEELAKSACGGEIAPAPADAKVPTWIRRILARGLSVRREDRYPSMDALIDALARDPQAARRRVATAAALLLLVSSVALVTRRLPANQPCSGAPALIGEVWNTQTQARLTDGFAKSTWPYARDAAARAAGALSTYAQRWAAMHREACEATQVRKEQSERAMELRMACLEQRRSELRALVGVLASADDAVIVRAPQAIDGLVSLESCSDVAALSAAQPLPLTSAARHEAKLILGGVAELKANYIARKLAAALELGAPLVERARRLGFQPLLAEVLEVFGQAHEANGNPREGLRNLKEANWAAERGGAEDIKIQSAVEIAEILTNQGDYESARDWVRMADATATRLSKRARFEPELRYAEGTIYLRDGRPAEAAAQFRRAAALAETIGDQRVNLNRYYNRLGAALADCGNKEEGLSYFKKALASGAPFFAPGDPRSLIIRGNIGEALCDMHRYSEALPILQAAVAERGKALPSDSEKFSAVLPSLGRALTGVHHYQEAIDAFADAIGIMTKHYGPKHPWIVGAHKRMGDAYLQSGRLKEAKVEYQQALDIAESLPKDHPALAEALTGMAGCSLAAGAPAEARALADRAAALYTRLGEKSETAATAYFLQAQVHGDHSQAAHARSLFEELHLREDAKRVADWLAAERSGPE
jgi:serine/threonine protein kinase/tetratricopeptide (TPR) repeat protein